MAQAIPKKSLGQHWLHDEVALQHIVDSAEVTKEDVVLEVGPGLGTLTERLVNQAKKVIAVEFDEALARDLPGRVKAENLEVTHQDILSFDFTSLEPHYKIVANIPYYLTSNLIRVISETDNSPETVVLLIQKEVAERAAAKPGDMSILSTTAQYYWEVSLGDIVPAELFTPPPKVDSQVLILKKRNEPLFEDVDTKQFFRLIKAGFSQKRKTLLNSLSAGLQLDRQETQNMCEVADIDSRRRAQSLSLDDWYALYEIWQQN